MFCMTITIPKVFNEESTCSYDQISLSRCMLSKLYRYNDTGNIYKLYTVQDIYNTNIYMYNTTCT